MKASRDQASLFGYISPVTLQVSTHPPLCACGACAMPVEQFVSAGCPNSDKGVSYESHDDGRA